MKPGIDESESNSEFEYRFQRNTEIEKFSAQGDSPITVIPSRGTSAQATIKLASSSDFDLLYSEVKGKILVSSGVNGNVIPIGIVESGRVSLYSESQASHIGKGKGIIAFAGTDIAYELEDTVTFSFRLKRPQVLFMKLKALPHRSRRGLKQIIPPADTEDLRRLLHFTLDEYRHLKEKWTARGQAQFDSLAKANAETALNLVREIAGIEPAEESGFKDLCLRCEQLIREDPTKRISAKELAFQSSCSVRQIYRAFEQILDDSPINYELKSRLLYTRACLQRAAKPGATYGQILNSEKIQVSRPFATQYKSEFGELPIETFQNRQALIQSILKMQ